MKAHPLLLTLALIVLLAGPAAGQGAGRGKSNSGGRGAGGSTPKVSTEVEIRIIRDYYSASGRKPKALPPGIAKNLARGKPMPPGIARTRVPDDLLVLLPARTGTRWLVVGDVVLLVDAGDLIVDLIRMVF
jgi:hypothetical protein